ncbi:ion transporter [Algimonas arctica]|uniref:Ion transporter n=1 Tax=Algimonas arctica TaxID=1479486 RepID=A0A8J3G1K8_9PROT|nr:hemolysin family protein [Algimonas arctica]GHA85936.1 ion transporter [Algimonas arctica]
MITDPVPQSDPAAEPPKPSFFAKVFRRRNANGLNGAESVSPTEKVAAQERMMDAAERFHLLRVDDVMVPRANIVAIEKTATLKELSKAFRDAGHSRLPVFEDTLDNPIAMVHIKDLLPYLMFDARGRTAKTYPDRKVIRTIKRQVLYVPPSMLAPDLLRRMQARRIHMAIVVDEYGGTDGLVTIEDLIEPIVGDIEDEHDELQDAFKKVVLEGGKVCWDADARMSIDDFEEAIGRDFATLDEEEEVDTLGGLVFTLVGRVPERGEIVVHPQGVEMEVIDADPRRVKRLRVTLPVAESDLVGAMTQTLPLT